MFLCVFFCKNSSKSFVFSRLTVGYLFPNFSIFAHLAYVSGLSQVMLKCEIRVELWCSVHFRSFVHLGKPGRVPKSIQFFPISFLQSAEQLSKLERSLCQIEIRSYFRPVFACIFVVGKNCCFLRIVCIRLY